MPEAEFAVVVRWTNYASATPDQKVELMAAFTDLAVADAEAKRLNLAVSTNQAISGVTYFVKIVKALPDGKF